MGRFALLIISMTLAAGCSQLITLNSDLNQADEVYQEFTVITPDNTLARRYVVVQLASLDTKGLLTATVMNSGSTTNLPSFFNLTNYVLVFEDTNRNFAYNIDEPTYLYPLADLENNEIRIDPNQQTQGGIDSLTGVDLTPYLEFDVKPERLGRIINWNDPAFSQQAREMGLWQPLQFIDNGYAGIFFLEPYQANKIPVLYVHGMGGSGKDFQTMIANLNRDKYQPWVINYPSALSLTLLSHSIAGMMRQLHDRHPYSAIHIVAHSMGGVLTQRYLNLCSVANRCELIRSFTSIASPFGGVSSAESGVKYSPVVMPSWRDLAPGADPIQSLFPSHDQSHFPPHLLIFAYQKSAARLGESSDGTILLSSQLRPEAQQQAESLYGANASHVNVLTSPDVYKSIDQFWLTVETRKKLDVQQSK